MAPMPMILLFKFADGGSNFLLYAPCQLLISRKRTKEQRRRRARSTQRAWGNSRKENSDICLPALIRSAWFLNHSNCPLCRREIHNPKLENECPIPIYNRLQTLGSEDFFQERFANHQRLRSEIPQNSVTRYETRQRRTQMVLKISPCPSILDTGKCVHTQKLADTHLLKCHV
ncbi:LOW QUALITY PROTEIN: hypothetical protein PanWU01x14_280170 [Parasponia andersonii]|uniref:Uncharacterized protein n=1 Tax=Parasponia andersonii TaxID=3476 RepID=A0A2P5B1H3_PARAD|nr:LOW QUALITY PROTEIN: hypothetical protein PanWU01x14_280170 [Parasponia andersonii]